MSLCGENVCAAVEKLHSQSGGVSEHSEDKAGHVEENFKVG